MHGSNAKRLAKLIKLVRGLRVRTPKFTIPMHKDLKKRFEVVTSYSVRTTTISVRMLGLATVTV